jgi:hypothetical protein
MQQCGSVPQCTWQCVADACGSVRRFSSARGCVAVCGSAAVAGSAHGCVRQCTRMCAAVCGCVRQCTRQCVAVHLAMCGSACDTVRLSNGARGSVWQCAAVRQCAAVWQSGSVQQCGSVQIFKSKPKYISVNLYKFRINQYI